MNLIQYLNNPAGKGSAVIPSKEIKSNLDAQFAKLQDSMKMNVYTKDNLLIYKIDIPSRSIDGVFYNVIIEYNLKDIPGNITNINELPFTCFSNCPSFIFTYAYVYNKNKLLCPWLKDKYSTKVLSDTPSARNQYKIISFERSMYLALKYISLLGRNKLERIPFLAHKINSLDEIKRNVQSETEILVRYNTGVEKKENTKVNKESESTSSKTPHRSGNDGYVKSSDTTKSTKKGGITAKTKKIKKI